MFPFITRNWYLRVLVSSIISFSFCADFLTTAFRDELLLLLLLFYSSRFYTCFLTRENVLEEIKFSLCRLYKGSSVPYQTNKQIFFANAAAGRKDQNAGIITPWNREREITVSIYRFGNASSCLKEQENISLLHTNSRPPSSTCWLGHLSTQVG